MSVGDGGDAPVEIAEALRFARRLTALEEGVIRARAAARILGRIEPDAAAVLLEVLARIAAPEARLALAAVGQALSEPRDDLTYQWIAQVYATATERGATEVAALLVAPLPRRPWTEPFDKPDSRLAHLTLGHKKAMARGRRDPDLLARLAAEGEPVVVRELLRNPQLTEPFVVRIASRRPCRPETLRCIHDSRRWRARPAVALAVARNPYVETELALKLLPSLGSAELRELARDGTIHPLVRAVAARLTEARRSR